MSNTDSIPDYQQFINESTSRISHFERLINRYSLARLAAVLLCGPLVYYTVKYEMVILTELSILLMMLVFTLLVKKQSGYTREKEFYIALQQVSQNELTIMAGGKTIYPQGEEWQDDKHPYTSDLDIYGTKSLFALVNRCATLPGNRLLASWLSAPAEVGEIEKRQEFIRELTALPRWKLNLQAQLLFAAESKADVPAQLMQYLSQSAAVRSGFLRTYIRRVPWVIATLLAGSFFSAYLLVPVLLLIGINACLVLANQLMINKAQRMTQKAGDALYHYSGAFKMIERKAWSSEMGKALALAADTKSEVSLSLRVKKLSRLLNYLETGGMSLVGPVLNLVSAWNLRQYLAIEDWKQENNPYLESAFVTLATFEAILSLVSLRTNYPQWCFPTVYDHADYTLEIKDAGHPLIPSAVRVTNDFTLTETRKIDIITGSNMAGKSTFLRTLGINGVLAFCGAPVCASYMQITPVQLFTYMRIKDSLNESTSTFKAELDRLQLLLTTLAQGTRVYFLVDEMLRGTNSADKYLGSRAIIEQLIRQQAVGIVATHDLQIAQLEKAYPGYIRNFYFDIRVEHGEMLFDYKIKNGECKTFNASLLLKQLGIEVENT
ncbi:MutS-related protein [Hufsiella ginkgonis]|uniref:DNA mismatch repair protein MutS n=1 Tax=Hufsiella ginkgonis TaxID=2695274 RepID=A0A7K1XWC3_9SPHI|nr:DNA mismatch repair protein MutS [Hufsiella ginkgonis]MXV15294.1 DNA mismatch repair protein MutS [Hufsiella ginkgonis]